MLVDLPSGETQSLEADNWPPECFLYIDATFPDADGMGWPVSLFTMQDVRLDAVEDLYITIQEVIVSSFSSPGAFTTLPEPLFSLVEALKNSSTPEDGELARDEYVWLAAYCEYFSEIAKRHPTFSAFTHGEDEGAGPGMTSAYLLFWDRAPEKALSHLLQQVAEDAARLRAIVKAV